MAITRQLGFVALAVVLVVTVQCTTAPPTPTVSTPIVAPSATPAPTVELTLFPTGVYASTPLPTPTRIATPATLFGQLDERWRTPSPAYLTGGATRYGNWRLGLDSLRYIVGAIKVDVENGGGGLHYGDLDERQRYLFALAELEYDDYEALIARKYDGIVALRSPSDVGREFTLYTAAGTWVGCAIVGDTAAMNDYYHYGESSLGNHRLIDYDFEGHPWVADLDNYLYERAGGNGGPALVSLSEGC